MTTSEDDDAMAARLAEASAHEAGHVVIARLEGAEVKWARAKLAGSGTTELENQGALQPRAKATIAVAGCVSDEILVSKARRELPPNDRMMLEQALGEIGDPSVTEETLRAEVRSSIEKHRKDLESVAATLSHRFNTKVPGTEL